MKELVSPKQVARAIGVSESSLKRWCDKGLLPTVRTAGGHRRLPISGVLTFLRQTRQPLVDPAVLGLPATSGKTNRIAARAKETLRDALLAGDELLCRQTVLDLWLAGQRVCEISDHVIGPAFTEIGERWSCHQADIYQERRACELIVRVLYELRMGLPPGHPKLVALGGTSSGDQYVIPTTVAELVLRDCGWHSRSLGSNIPFDSLSLAIRENRPRLFWLSVSYIPDVSEFVTGFEQVAQAARDVGAAVAVGGYALTMAVRQQLQYSAFCDTMLHLEQFANLCRQQVDPAELVNQSEFAYPVDLEGDETDHAGGDRPDTDSAVDQFLSH